MFFYSSSLVSGKFRAILKFYRLITLPLLLYRPASKGLQQNYLFELEPPVGVELQH
jgi:hypothetical protein